MKKIAWDLMYLPAYVCIFVGYIVAIVVWSPLIVWFMVGDALEQQEQVGVVV